jgi:hypothetical protein
MRSLVIVACLLGVPCASWGQSSQASWENLSTLQAGQKIQVVEMNSKKDSGTFLNVSATTISLQEKSGEQTVQRHDVRSVKLMENKQRLHHTLIGAAVGAGAGAGIGAAVDRPPKPCPPDVLCLGGFDVPRGVVAAVGAVIGSLCGAAVGALLPSHKMIYRVAGGGS